MKKTILLLFITLLFTAQTQVKQALRKEIEKDDIGYGSTINLEKNGILTYGLTREKKIQTLNLIFLDTDFEEKLAKSIEIEDDYTLYSVSHSDDKKRISFLFIDDSKFYFLNYDTESLSESKVTGVLPSDFSIRYRFGSLNVNNHLILYSVTKKKKSVLSIDVNSGSVSRINFFDGIKKFDISSLEKIENKELAYFVIKEYVSKKVSILKVFVFNENGELENEAITLDDTFEKHILDLSLTYITDTKFTITGSYSVGQKKYSPLANGIYFAEFENFKQNYIKYYSFTDFKNFFEYIGNKKEKDKIDKKIKKKQKRGVDEVVSVLIKMHPVIFNGGNYTLLGEVYYPTYRTETYTTYVNGKATTSTRRVFDGYQYSHATILNLDKDGEKQYDQCFQMYLSNKPYYVAKNIHVKKEKNQITLLYCTGNQFKSCKVDNDGATEKDYGKIEMEKSSDKIISSSFTNAMYWYDNYFLSYGTQYIKNKEEKLGNRKRTVFVLTKIEI